MGVPVEHLYRDRSAEFREAARRAGSLPEDSPPPAKYGAPAAAATPQLAESAGFMRSFFGAVNEIQGTLKQGRAGVEAMGKLREEALQVTTSDRERAVSDGLAQLVEEINGHVTGAKFALEALRQRSDAEDVRKPGSPERQIRANMQKVMARKHQELLLEYQKAQTEFKQVLERRQAREMQILCPGASEEEVQEMIDAGETSSQMIVQKMAGAHALIFEEVQRIREKHAGILQLEHSIADLLQMQREIAVLVDEQAGLLDSIEANVHRSCEHTHQAEKELVTAKKAQRNTRKWMCYVIAVLMVLALIIMFPVML